LLHDIFCVSDQLALFVRFLSVSFTLLRSPLGPLGLLLAAIAGLGTKKFGCVLLLLLQRHLEALHKF
jgi:hypothetical protein